MERIVIVCYRPKEGKLRQLKNLVKDHWSVLNEEGLVSKRQPIILNDAENNIVEIFGWKSKEAIENAHQNVKVQELWNRFVLVCDYVAPSELAEFQKLFSEFNPVQ